MDLPGTGAPLEPYGYGRGYVDHLSPSQPAAGSGLTIALDPTFLFRPISVRFSVTTDANVANRFPSVDYTDPEGNVYLRNAAGLVLTASTTGQVFDFNIQRTVAEWATNTDILAPLCDTFIPAGWQIRITLGSIQAADQISAVRILTEKWVTGGPGGEASAALAGGLAGRARR